MYADARCLLEEAKELQHIVRRNQPGSPGCHINQALEALDEPTIGPCSVSRAYEVGSPANVSIAEAAVHLKAALGAAKEIQDAADEANESVRIAATQTNDASDYIRRRNLIDDAKAASDTLRKRSIGLADRLDGLRDAITGARDYMAQLEVHEIDASSLYDTLVEIEDALRDAENLADASKRAYDTKIAAFKEWPTALGAIDDSGAKLVTDEASGLSSLAKSATSSLESATRAVREISLEVESMRVKPTETYPLDELKVHLANARDHGLRLKEANLGDPIQEIQRVLSDAKEHLAKILSSGNDTKTVREVAGLKEGETALPADITKPFDTYHEDAAVLRSLRHDDLEATLSSLLKARNAASALAMAGMQRTLKTLTVQIDDVFDQAARLRPAPLEDKIKQYVQTLERAGVRLRPGTTSTERIHLDSPVKDNLEALSYLRNGLDEADGHLAAVVGIPRVPSLETRAQLHANLVKLVSLAEAPSLKSHSEVRSASIRASAAAWRRRLVAAKNGIERDLATVAELGTRVAGVENKVDVLAAQLEQSRPSLNSALTKLKAAQSSTKRFSDAANQGIPDTPWDDAVREHVIGRIGDLGMKLKAKAFYSAETHTALAPCCRDVRIAMAGFANLASELSNQLESRADALQWQLDKKFGADARKLPLSLYLRDAEPTDFVNLYTWNRAAAPALLPDMFWHPLNAFSSDETADRVRVIERLFADHNWGKINTVYGSGQGDFTMALVKDEIGNWSLKSFEADPSKLVKAYTELTLAALTKVRRKVTGSGLPQPELLHLTGNLAAGQIGDSTGALDIFDTERLHERVVGELTGIRNNAIKTRDELATKRNESEQKAEESELNARLAEAEAQSAPLLPGPSTCATQASCLVEMTLAKALEAKTEAFKAEISVRDIPQGTTAKATSTTTTLANEAVKHANEAETKVANISATPPAAVPESAEAGTAPTGDSATPTAASPKSTEDSAKEAHLLAEKAKAFAAAATAWAAHSRAIAEQERAFAALNAHRAEVNARIREVLDDYAAVIATLLESRTPSDSSPEITDEAQTDVTANDDA